MPDVVASAIRDDDYEAAVAHLKCRTGFSRGRSGGVAATATAATAAAAARRGQAQLGGGGGDGAVADAEVDEEMVAQIQAVRDTLRRDVEAKAELARRAGDTAFVRYP